jgi:hypothetical protein
MRDGLPGDGVSGYGSGGMIRVIDISLPGGAAIGHETALAIVLLAEAACLQLLLWARNNLNVETQRSRSGRGPLSKSQDRLIR